MPSASASRPTTAGARHARRRAVEHHHRADHHDVTIDARRRPRRARRTTTTTTARPSRSRRRCGPGPMAAPTPAAPVTLTETTPALDHVPTTDKVIFLGIDDGLVRDPALLTLLRSDAHPAHALPRARARARRRDLLQGDADARRDGAGPHDRPPAAEDARLERPAPPDLRRDPGPHDDLRHAPDAVPAAVRRVERDDAQRRRGLRAARARSCGAAPPTTAGSTSSAGSSTPATSSSCTSAPTWCENLQLVLARAQAEGYKIGRLEDYLGTGPRHPMFDR